MDALELVSLILTLVLIAFHGLSILLVWKKIGAAETRNDKRHVRLVACVNQSFRLSHSRVLKSLRTLRQAVRELSSGTSGTSPSPSEHEPAGRGSVEGCDGDRSRGPQPWHPGL